MPEYRIQPLRCSGSAVKFRHYPVTVSAETESTAAKPATGKLVPGRRPTSLKRKSGDRLRGNSSLCTSEGKTHARSPSVALAAGSLSITVPRLHRFTHLVRL